MKKVSVALAILICCCSFALSGTLSGTWEYEGGIYNGKPQGPTKDYTLQRKYDELHYQSFVVSKDEPPEKYEGGDYQLKGDTCLETQTFSSQPSKLTGKTLRYFYSFKNDTLVLRGSLPSGMTVVEYWKKIK